MFKSLLLALTVVLIAVGATLWYRHDVDKSLPPLRTADVERGDISFTIDATGTVEPEEVVDVGAQVAGIIERLGVDPRTTSKSIDYGSPVDVGTVLAHIDDSLYQSDLQQNRAQVESAQAMTESTAAQQLEAEANVERSKKDLLQYEAKLVQAERDWQRVQDLWRTQKDALSEADYDAAKATYLSADSAVGVAKAAINQAEAQLANSRAAVDKAKADLDQSQATLKRSQTNLSYCTIKSPVAGVIIDRRINVGQTVVSSLNSPSLFLIAKDLKRLQVWASVNEADIGNIHSGQTVHFSVDTFPGQTFDGVVAADQPRLNATMNQNVVTYTVVVDTDNANGKLIPYLTADVNFQVAEHASVLLVPNNALRWKPTPERLAAAGLADPAADSGGPAKKGQSHKRSGGAEDRSRTEGTIWLADGSQLRPVKVAIVMSDDSHTEIAADDIHEGDHVVIGENFAAAAGGESSDPFSPKLFGGKKPQQ